MVLFNQLKNIINKLSELEIPNYETRLGSYLDEDSFIDYLLVLLEDKTRWTLGGSSKYMQYIVYEKKDGSLISLQFSEYKITIAVDLSSKKTQKTSALEGEKVVTEIVKSRFNRKKFKKLVRSYKITENYLCELKEGSIRYKIKRLFGC